MKKLGTYILSGLVLGGVVISNLQPVFANDKAKELVESQAVEKENEVDEDMLLNSTESFEGYIRGLTSLSDEEKEKLLNAQAELEPTWDKIDSIEDKINQVYEELFGEEDEDELSNEKADMLEQQAREKTADYEEELKGLFKIVDEKYQENAEIWEKTYQENAECKVEIVDEIPCES